MSRQHALWIGHAERGEFRSLRDWLSHSAPEVAFHFAPTMAEVSTVLATTAPPDLVIIGESWPDEFTSADISQLLTVTPLARIVCVTGAWSEAVGRTRSHWPPAWRVPLWDAIPRLERELTALAACRSGTPGSAADFPPWTASRQETWQWQQDDATASQTDSAARLRIDLREIADPAYAAWLTAALESAGHVVTRDAADIVLLDVEPWSPMMAERAQQAIARHPHAVPIAITGWSTPELRGELQSLGISDLVDKLSPQSLIRLLEDILPSRDRLGASSATGACEELAP